MRVRSSWLDIRIKNFHKIHNFLRSDFDDNSIQHTVGRLFAGGCLLAGSLALTKAQDASTQPPAQDNTKINQRDKSGAEPTADQQKENVSDRAIAQQIRKALMNEKSLSTYAHNVKVLAQNGMVTLKGPVRSDEEKQTVEAKAAEVVGKDKVTSELAVQPKK